MMSSVQRLAILEAAISKMDEAILLIGLIAREKPLSHCEKLDFIDRVTNLLEEVDPGWAEEQEER
ncbi:hypothetical protein [Arenibaculum pallidiluteum]|uniref:hypothetical protein n=1 Tax=Arenibaculum pallidiluteum TaxID=2812559 RepID=UPI001A96B9CA|nr:hypothetical protein [Arenibaculum pallidiluteum]